MSHPEIVQSALDDEPVAARVDLGGEDTLFVTPSRTLIYRAEGLLSDESVEEYPNDAERVAVSESRRKSKVSMDYGLDGERTFTVPTKRLDDALHPVLAGVLNAAEITGAGETVKRTFRFSELTLVITSVRVVKHVGAAVWDGDYEEYHYEDVTDLAFEDGSVATSVVVTTGDRQERFKTPNEESRAVREGLESTLLAYHDVGSLEEFRTAVAPADDADSETEDVAFGDGPDPLSANPSELSDDSDNATRTDAPGGGRVVESSTGPVASDAGGVSDETAGNAATEHAPAADAAADGTATERGGPGDSGATDGHPPADAAESASAANPGDDAEFADSAFRQVDSREEELAAELRALREVVEAQSEELRAQRELVEQLIEDLRQGR